MSIAVETMGRRLSTPFARGADTLALRLERAGNPNVAQVVAYLATVAGPRFSFEEHGATFGSEPDPRYVLTCEKDIAVDTTVTVTWLDATNTAGVTDQIEVPAGTLAGTGFVLRLGKWNPPGPPGPQLTAVRMFPPAPDGEAAVWWSLTALLGNTAKLLWAAGHERDRIGRELRRVAEQRQRKAAFGRSLDLLGYDLGVPRFLPLPYGFDADTVALLHLDDEQPPPPGQPDAEDRMGRYRPTAHHATNPGGEARAQATGRFGTAFAFRTPGAELHIDDHADFAVAATESFTVECFFQPDAGADGHVISKQATPGSTTDPGWTLELGEFGRGLPANVRCLISDGSSAIAAYADVTLTTDRFHHIAAVVDRASRGGLLLYVDGVLRDRWPVDGFGALTNPAPIRIGRHTGTGASGVVDEVRVSRVARRRFDPVLGEGDATYRRRLGIFQRWTLPTPANVQSALNEVVDGVAGDPDPFVVDDTPATLVGGTAPVRLAPVRVGSGGRIDQLGNRRVTEEEACGGPDDREADLELAWLVREDDPRPAYDPPPPRTLDAGEHAPDTRLMHVAASRALRRLLDRLGAVPGVLTLRSAFDPRAGDLRAVGRGLLIAHDTVGLSDLATHAHMAGFDFVQNRAQSRAVYVAVHAGEQLEVALQPAPAAGRPFALMDGDTVTLTTRPSPPGATQYEWALIPTGEGRAKFVGPVDRPTAQLQASAPGWITIRVDATHRGSSASGTRAVRIGPADLADGATIALDGRADVPAYVADGPVPEPFFHPTYLVHMDDPRIAYNSRADTRRMQTGVARVLTRLLDQLDAAGEAGLELLEAYDRGAADIAARGRRLLLSHSTLPAGALAARAHGAGFLFVARAANRVEVRHGEDELLSVRGDSPVDEGQQGNVTVDQHAAPAAVTATASAVYTANRGTDSVSELDPASGAVRRDRTFKVGHHPVAIAANPAGTRVYTADSGSNTVSVVDLASGAVIAALAVGKGPVDVLHHPTLDRLYVACGGDSTVRSIDTATLAPLASAGVGGGELRLALSSNGTRLWVTSPTAPQVRVLTSQQLAPSATYALSAPPGSIALAKGNANGWITLPSAGRIARIDQGTGVVSAEYPVGEHPSEIVVAPGDAELYVVDRRTGGTAVGLVIGPAGAELARFTLRRTVTRIAAGPAPRIYAPARDGGLAVLDRTAAGVAFVGVWRLGSGLGEELTWIAHPLGGARADFVSLTRPTSRVTAERAGPVAVRAVYSLGDHTPPYTFEVRLKPALEVAQTVIRKDQYDLVMNVLNLLHPIGVEVRTRRIRDYVVEVREGLLEAFPDYTYPNFRVPGPVPVGPREE